MPALHSGLIPMLAIIACGAVRATGDVAAPSAPTPSEVEAPSVAAPRVAASTTRPIHARTLARKDREEHSATDGEAVRDEVCLDIGNSAFLC